MVTRDAIGSALFHGIEKRAGRQLPNIVAVATTIGFV